MFTKSKILQEEAQAEATAAREIAEKAEDEKRNLTRDEKTRYDAHMEKAKGLVPQIKQLKQDEEVIAQAKALVMELGPPIGARETGQKGWAQKALHAVRGTATDHRGGIKALVSGSIGVPNVISEIVANPTAPRTILDLLLGDTGDGDPYAPGSYDYQTSAQLEESFTTGYNYATNIPGGAGGGGSNTYNFLRQTVRTNNAAPVADSAVKPTSIYTLAEIEDRYRVIAHLSEAIPQRYFHDDQSLGEFLASEMALGLETKVETQALSGDGLGENLTGILSTSGIQSQAWATNLFTTTRQALTKLQALGMTPTAWALNPSDIEKLDLIQETTGAFILGDPGGMSTKTLWTIPRVPSVAVPAGTGILADWKQAKLLVRQDATLNIDTGGTLFTRNEAVFRMEGRFGLAVKRPSAFVKVTLTGV